MNSVNVLAPAKLNWTLEVVGRREDGYHDLVSIAQTIGMFDRLTFMPAEDVSLELEGNLHSGLRNDEENLVMRAIRLLQQRTGITAGMRIELQKGIPVSAGLGGGSSDAAATLRVLNRMWDLRLPPDDLAALAAELGSDVPFFLTGGTAKMTGRGTMIAPLADVAPVHILIAVPGDRRLNKTASAYGLLGPANFRHGSCSQLLEGLIGKGQQIDPRHMFNTFDDLLADLYPELAPIWAYWRAHGNVPHLAGSGPGSYLISTSREGLEELATETQSRFGVRTIVTTTIDRISATGEM